MCGDQRSLPETNVVSLFCKKLKGRGSSAVEGKYIWRSGFSLRFLCSWEFFGSSCPLSSRILGRLFRLNYQIHSFHYAPRCPYEPKGLSYVAFRGCYFGRVERSGRTKMCDDTLARGEQDYAMRK